MTQQGIISGDVLVAAMRRDAEKALARHQLAGETYWSDGRGARWYIRDPEDSTGATEIIAGICGSLVVHGDYDGTRFAYYGDRPSAWSRLLWMADCRDLTYYVAQKATIGGRGEKSAWVYDERVALFDLERHAADAEQDGEGGSEVARILREAKEHTEHEDELWRFIHEEDKGHDLWELDIGRALRWSVVIGHAALGRCAALLREKHGAEGPPECRDVAGRAA